MSTQKHVTIWLASLMVVSVVLLLGGDFLFGVGSQAAIHQASLTPTVFIYLPALAMEPTPTPTPYTCPTSSGNVYVPGTAYQYDTDNPVRPAYAHADKNIELRGYTPNTDPGLVHDLVDYGPVESPQPPQFATLFATHRVPALVGFYQVHHWNWGTPPDPGTRADAIQTPDVTALGLATSPGESLHVPVSGYTLGGAEALVLFADEDTIALRYTRHDSSAPPGYTVHIDGICVDPNLLQLYNQLDDPEGPRYQYPNPSYDLVALTEGQAFGTAKDTELVVAISDTGAFQDPRSCDDWWQIRPGYTGTCPAP